MKQENMLESVWEGYNWKVSQGRFLWRSTITFRLELETWGRNIPGNKEQLLQEFSVKLELGVLQVSEENNSGSPHPAPHGLEQGQTATLGDSWDVPEMSEAAPQPPLLCHVPCDGYWFQTLFQSRTESVCLCSLSGMQARLFTRGLEQAA